MIEGIASALAPASLEAQRILALFEVLLVGAVIIWIAVLAIAWHGARRDRKASEERIARGLIVIGGVITPLVVLSALLVWALPILPQLRAPAPPDALRVRVIGEQWWWRVQYPGRDGRAFVELANEIRLPRGERVELVLESADVIHSLWIPQLGAKVDMIPGRTNRMPLEPTRSGEYRAICAEFCGGSHAWMQLAVIVGERAELDAWLAQQAREAAPPTSEIARRGLEAFLANGCGACHSIRGTSARGTIGPDLTHVGGRRTLAAATLANDPRAFARWIAHATRIKPEALMPAYDMLPGEELEAIAAYLDGLQ